MDCITRSKLPLAQHQIEVVNYLDNPNVRGIIAVHGIGTGKTLLAVAASQCFLDKFPNSKVIVVSPKSLIQNFKNGMVEYGLSGYQNKYIFYSFDTFMRKMDIFSLCKDNMLIVDEAHNLRTFAPTIGKKAEAVIKCSKTAKKILLLTATPYVNKYRDMDNLVAMVKGTDPLRSAWNNMFLDKEKRDKYLKGVFSLYFREQTDEFYPKRIDKDIEIVMDEDFLQEYYLVEEEQENRYNLANPWIFLNGVRQGLLRIENSNKVKFVVDKVVEKYNKGKKTVIYSNFVECGIKYISKLISAKGIETFEFFGGTTPQKRSEIINRYNKGKIKVLLISAAGGEGINLLETNSIFILDPPWNDARLEQAIGRVIRYKSHINLPESERYVEVYTLYSVKPIPNKTMQFLSADEIIKGIIIKKREENIKVIEALGDLSIGKTIRASHIREDIYTIKDVTKTDIEPMRCEITEGNGEDNEKNITEEILKRNGLEIYIPSIENLEELTLETLFSMKEQLFPIQQVKGDISLLNLFRGDLSLRKKFLYYLKSSLGLLEISFTSDGNNSYNIFPNESFCEFFEEKDVFLLMARILSFMIKTSMLTIAYKLFIGICEKCGNRENKGKIMKLHGLLEL